MDIILSQPTPNDAIARIESLARQVLLGDADAHEQLIGYFTQAHIAWERQAVALIALLLMPSTTHQSATEFMDMAFTGPLLKLLTQPREKRAFQPNAAVDGVGLTRVS